MADGQLPRVLVADDEDAIRTLVARMLTRAGFDPVEASDGQHAIERLDAATFDAGTGWRGGRPAHARLPFTPTRGAEREDSPSSLNPEERFPCERQYGDLQVETDHPELVGRVG